jgi:hypothetical protein
LDCEGFRESTQWDASSLGARNDSPTATVVGTLTLLYVLVARKPSTHTAIRLRPYSFGRGPCSINPHRAEHYLPWCYRQLPPPMSSHPRDREGSSYRNRTRTRRALVRLLGRPLRPLCELADFHVTRRARGGPVPKTRIDSLACPRLNAIYRLKYLLPGRTAG